MRHKTKIILELTPAAIDGAVLRYGRVLRAARVELKPADWRQAWEEGLSPFDGKLCELIAALDADGATIDIAYRSPTSYAEVITVPVTGSAAHGAAMLSLTEHVNIDLEQHPHAITPIASATANGTKSTHTLAVADDSSVSETLGAWLRRAGCKLASAGLSSALTITDAVEQADKSSGNEVAAEIYVHRNCSLLSVTSGGSVRLIRRIEIGFDDFVSAINRPIQRRDSDADPIRLSLTQAQQILCDSGIPEFRSTVDEALGLTGQDILPLIQPALQRLAIEIKQSLRFELTSAERDLITLRGFGPFGSMPNLVTALCDQNEIAAGDCDTAKLDRSIVEKPFMGFADRPAQLSAMCRSNPMLSRGIIGDQRLESFRGGLRIGAAAAVVAMIAVAYVTHSQIQDQRDSAQNLGQAMTTVDEIIALNATIEHKRVSLALTQARMHESIGTTMRWSDALAALPGLIPDSVTVLDIDGSERTDVGQPKFELAGIARPSAEVSSQKALNTFIESLNACPLVSSVDLGNTQRVGDGTETESMRFSLVVNLVATPRFAVTSVETGETP